jgi:predicted secreted protein
MEIRILKILFFLFCSLSMLSPEEGESLNNHPMAVDFGFNGQRIAVNSGEEIQIELEAIGGTGYSWHLDGLDQNLFQVLSEGVKPPDKETEHVGGNPVMMFWKLKALKPGTAAVKLNYYRVWEGKGTAAKHFEVEVQIIY